MTITVFTVQLLLALSYYPVQDSWVVLVNQHGLGAFSLLVQLVSKVSDRNYQMFRQFLPAVFLEGGSLEHAGSTYQMQ